MVQPRIDSCIGSARLAAALALVACCVGCGSPEQIEVHPVWPPPPAAARFVHIQNVRKPSDLAEPSFLDKLGELVTGRDTVSLIRPSGVSVREGEYLYVTDQEQQALLIFSLKSPKVNIVTRVGEVFFVSPVDVVACGETLAVSDSVLKKVYLLNAKGKLIDVLDKPGGFERPTGMAFDPEKGQLYVVDTLANEICVFDLDSRQLAWRFGKRGEDKGQFNYPTHICLDQAGSIYVTDSMNFRMQVFDPRGRYRFHVGKLGDASGHLMVPKGVAVDSFGHIYIVDSYSSTVQVFDQQGRFLLAIGKAGAEAGRFQIPTGLTIDSTNKLYVCDSFNKRVQIIQYVGDSGDESEAATP